MAEKTKESELGMLLRNIGGLLVCYAESGRTESRIAILRAMCSEVDLVCRKLSKMNERWSQFLPFKEAIDVNFEEWQREVERWANLLAGTANCLSHGFVMDVTGGPEYELNDELEKCVPEVCAKVDKRLKESFSDWEESAYGGLNELRNELEWEKSKLCERLGCLKNELNELEEFFNSELKERQFEILAYRLYHRDCKQAVKDAKSEVNKAHNSWPKRNVKVRAMQMRDRMKQQLLTHEIYQGLADYLDLDSPELFEEGTFGQFLFMNRHALEVSDVQTVVKTLEIIRELNKFIYEGGSQPIKSKRALGRELTQEEKKIIRTLLALVEKGRWRGGVTAASIILGVKRMLGVDYPLDGEEQELSDSLWKLLKSRRQLDADQSLKRTWLNIVGWCVQKGYLSGSGSPALCKEFYPNAGDDDYKAIDKGRTEPPANFAKVIPLLERFLR